MYCPRNSCGRLSIAAIAAAFLFINPLVRAQDEPVFSGPQVGETLPGFSIQQVFGDDAGKIVDPVSLAGDKPMVLIFFNERTRPSFGITNTVMRFAQTRKDKGLSAGIVFLTDDLTETENWLKQVARLLPQEVTIGISPDGKEGSGALGLNRNVAVTVIVAREKNVVANFALIQPSIEADGPKIFQAIVDVTGGGDVPDVAKFTGNGARMAANRPTTDNPRPAEEQDPELRPMLSKLINKTATEDQVVAAAKVIETYAASHPLARRQIADIANRIIDAERLEFYGTPKAQEYLKHWSVEFRKPASESDSAGDNPDGDKPAGDKPAGDKPAGDKPVGDKPAGDKPAGDNAKPRRQQALN